MPCEPVSPGVPTTRGRPSSSNVTSSLAFRMKRLGSGSGARRALTSLGSNDTQLNLRLAKSLLTISQEKFAKKWDFDPVREVPLPQGRFYWTPTTANCTPSSSKLALDGGSTCRLLGTVTSSSGSSHDLADAEAEDNAAALRTCLNLPTTSDTITTAGQIAVTTVSQDPRIPSCISTNETTTTPGQPVVSMTSQEPRLPPCISTNGTTITPGQPAVTMTSHEPRVPPCISTSDNITTSGQSVVTMAPQEPTAPICISTSYTIPTPGQPVVTMASQEPRIPPCISTSDSIPTPEQYVVTISEEPRVPPPHSEGAPCKPNTTTEPSRSGSTSEAVGDARRGLSTTLVDNERAAGAIGDARRGLSTTLVDKERASDAIQDNQCQYIDPTSSPATDERRQQATALTQACITNYLRPRKRSSAHLQETVHSPKAKKVLLAA